MARDLTGEIDKLITDRINAALKSYDNVNHRFHVAMEHDRMHALNSDLDHTPNAYNNIALGSGSLAANVNKTHNAAIGYRTLYKATGVDYSIAIGSYSQFENLTGAYNISIGAYSLYHNTAGTQNVAIGDSALHDNTASYNVAIGYNAMWKNTSGDSNTSVGYCSMKFNTDGGWNIAIGSFSLGSNTTGWENIAIGVETLFHNTDGDYNVAVGNGALHANTTGLYNNAIGDYALNGNTTGDDNIAIGFNALHANSIGNSNIAIGFESLYHSTGNGNVAVGDSTLIWTTGNYNTAIGHSALITNVTGVGNIAIGYQAGYYETTSNKLFIDNAKRTNEADGRISALVYGVFDATPANQTIRFNVGHAYINGDEIATSASLLPHDIDSAVWHNASSAADYGKFVRSNPSTGEIEFDSDNTVTTDNMDLYVGYPLSLVGTVEVKAGTLDKIDGTLTDFITDLEVNNYVVVTDGDNTEVRYVTVKNSAAQATVNAAFDNVYAAGSTISVFKAGSDLNDGSDPDVDHALASVNGALAKLPGAILHYVYIHVIPGNHLEDISILNKIGYGIIIIMCDYELASNDYMVQNRLIAENIAPYLGIENIRFMSTTIDNMIFNNCGNVYLERIKSAEVLSGSGINAFMSKVEIVDCEISNKTYAIQSGFGTEILSDTNAGSGNDYGLYAALGGYIHKSSTQPTGTVANELIDSGGVIFPLAAAQISDFDTEVSNNADVAANTSARHTRLHSVTDPLDHSASAVGDKGKILKANESTGAMELSSDLATVHTIGTKYIYRADGTDVPVADGGTGVSDLAYLDLDTNFDFLKAVKGTQSLTNIVTNGKFASTASWVAENSTHAVTSNVLSNTGNGTSALPYEKQTGMIAAVAGDKIYVRLRCRVTNADSDLILAYVADSDYSPALIIASQANPVINTWYTLSGIATVAAGSAGNILMVIYHRYADAATANGKVMQIDGVYGVIAIDLTSAFGAGSEPTAAVMDTLIDNYFSGWFDGTKYSGVSYANKFQYMTSAEVATAVTDETGSGALVFATSPTLVTPVLGAATGTSLALGGSLSAGYTLDVTGYINSTQTVDNATYPTVNAVQNATTLQDGSASTGADEQQDNLWTAIKFTASADMTIYSYGIRLKRTGTITNTAQYIGGYIYSDSAGSPGAALAGTSYGIITYGALTTSYAEYQFAPGTVALTSGTSYWLVFKQSVAPSGGTVQVDTTNSGTALYSEGGNAATPTWVNKDTVTGWFKLYSRTYIGVYGSSTNAFGVSGYSVNNYGVRGVSVNTHGVVGISSSNYGVYGNSTYNIGVVGQSTSNYGTYGTSSTSIGAKGLSTSGYGVQGVSSSNYGVEGASTTGVGGNFYINPSATNTMLAIMNLRRYTSGTAAAGIGGSIDYYINDASGNSDLRGQIACLLTTATHASEKSAITLYTSTGGAAPVENWRFDDMGNFIIGNTACDTTGTKMLAIKNGTAPAAHVDDMIHIYSTDITGGDATLGLMLENAVAADVSLASTHSLTIKVNGTTYKLALTEVV